MWGTCVWFSVYVRLRAFKDINVFPQRVDPPGDKWMSPSCKSCVFECVCVNPQTHNLVARYFNVIFLAFHPCLKRNSSSCMHGTRFISQTKIVTHKMKTCLELMIPFALLLILLGSEPKNLELASLFQICFAWLNLEKIWLIFLKIPPAVWKIMNKWDAICYL